MSDAVLYSSSDRIGVITLNRPEARNAVNREVAVGLEASVDRAAFDEALRLARQIASSGPLAVRASRRVVLAAADQDDETLKQVAKKLLHEVLASEDSKEGLTAFIEKRPPRWKAQ